MGKGQSKPAMSTSVNSPTSIESSSGFHVVEIHGGTLAHGAKLLLALAMLMLMFYAFKRYRKARNRGKAATAKPTDIELGIIKGAPRSGPTVIQEFQDHVMPFVSRTFPHLLGGQRQIVQVPTHYQAPGRVLPPVRPPAGTWTAREEAPLRQSPPSPTAPQQGYERPFATFDPVSGERIARDWPAEEE